MISELRIIIGDLLISFALSCYPKGEHKNSLSGSLRNHYEWSIKRRANVTRNN